jgi:hypothetical protein
MEVPDISPEDIDRATEDDAFNTYIEDFANYFDSGFPPESSSETINKFYIELEVKGEVAIERLMQTLIEATTGTSVLDPKGTITDTVNSISDKVTVSPETTKALTDAAQGKPVDEATKQAIVDEATSQSKVAQTEIENQPTPEKKAAASTLDKLATETVDKITSKEPPTKGGWLSLLQDILRFLRSILPLVLVGLGFWFLKAMAEAMTGCFQIYDKTKTKKLNCGDFDYGDDNIKGYCTCITSDYVQGCTGAENLYIDGTSYDAIATTCHMADTSSASCLSQDIYKYNPICAIVNSHCFNPDPLICDLKGRTVYYTYQQWDWGSLLSNVFNNWPNLFDDSTSFLQKIVKLIIITLIIIVSIFVLYSGSKLIFRKLNYRVDNTQMKRLTQNTKTTTKKSKK